MKTARIGGVELAIVTGIALSNVDDPNAALTRFLDQLDGPIQHPTFKLIFHCAVTVARRIRERILEIDENERGFTRIEMRFKRWQSLGLRFCCDTQQCRQQNHHDDAQELYAGTVNLRDVRHDALHNLSLIASC